MKAEYMPSEQSVIYTKSYVSFDKAIDQLDKAILEFEDDLLEAGIRLVNGKWQIWIKVEQE